MNDKPEDALTMYLIVRESLKMSIGKTAAQCAHASQMLQLQYQEMCQNYQSLNIHRDLFDKKFNIFEKWLNTSFRKVVLKADDKEWTKLKLEFKDSIMLVVDSGLTEVAPNTETVIGLWPMYKNQAPKIVQRLQTL